MSAPPPPPKRPVPPVAPPAAPPLPARSTAASASLTTAGHAAAYSKGFSIVGRVKGVLLVITVLALIVGAFFINPVMRESLRREGIEPTGLTGLALNNAWLTALLALPALATSIPLLRGAPRPFYWMTISSILLLLPLASFLLGTLGGVVELYSRALNL